MKFRLSSRMASVNVTKKEETKKEEVKRRPPIEDIKQQVAEWLQERRKAKAPILKALLAQMRQEPDSGILHYEFAFHLLAIPLPIMEDGNSWFWYCLDSYLFYHELNEEAVIAADHLNLALSRNMNDHLVAAKARFLTISLFMAEHNLYRGRTLFQDYPRLITLTNEMIYEGQKYSKFKPASLEALYIQREGYYLLGNRYGMEEVDQAIERAYTLQWNDLDEADTTDRPTHRSNEMAGIPSEIKEQIRRKAATEWPDDFEMQKHVIQQQTQAFMALESYARSDIPDTVMSDVRQKAKREWPVDFEMQLHVIEQQVKAYLSLRRSSYLGVPQNIFERIQQKAVREWPDDFEMQKHVIDQQVQAYLELES